MIPQKKTIKKCRLIIVALENNGKQWRHAMQWLLFTILSVRWNFGSWNLKQFIL
jgi:hypothetical protein